MLAEYFPVLIFLLVSFSISIIMTVIPLIGATKRKGDSKGDAFECGFDAFENAHGRFDVKFFLVAILFVVFDLEVAFLFPWAMSFGEIGEVGFWAMMIFLFVLTVGFIYEWKKGALDWD